MRRPAQRKDRTFNASCQQAMYRRTGRAVTCIVNRYTHSCASRRVSAASRATARSGLVAVVVFQEIWQW